jgi:Cytochrome P460
VRRRSGGVGALARLQLTWGARRIRPVAEDQEWEAPMRYALSATAAVMLISSAALAGPELIEFPEGYQDSFTHYATVNRADERKQVVKIFGNDVALTSAKDGAALDSGSVLVMEIYKAKLDAEENPVVGSDGFFEQDELAAIAVMESRTGWGDEYPEEIRNGTWEYALFDAKAHTLLDREYRDCFACHKPLQEFDYVFSFAQLRDAAGN